MDEHRIIDLRLTINELDQFADFKDLSPEQKAELITLVFELSLALFKLYGKEHE